MNRRMAVLQTAALATSPPHHTSQTDADVILSKIPCRVKREIIPKKADKENLGCAKPYRRRRPLLAVHGTAALGRPARRKP